MQSERNELIILRNVVKDPIVNCFCNAIDNDDIGAYTTAYSMLLEKNAQRNFADYLAKIIISDDNIF